MEVLLRHFFGNPASPIQWPALGFPVFFVGLWLLICSVLSAMGGWREWARHYAATSPFAGTRFRLRSGRLGTLHYNGCLTLGADRHGLYLAVLPFFRVGHPPLFVPWSDVRVREARSWLSDAVELEFARAPGASLRLSRRLAQALSDASGEPARVAPDPSLRGRAG